MDDLVTWLRAQLDEDERAVTGSGDLGWLTYRRPDGTMAYTVPASLAPDGSWIAVGAVARDFASAVVVSCERERLAEVDAKRQMVALHVPVAGGQGFTGDKYGRIDFACQCCGDSDEFGVAWPCDTVLLVALPYADRPGYQQEWQP